MQESKRRGRDAIERVLHSGDFEKDFGPERTERVYQRLRAKHHLNAKTDPLPPQWLVNILYDINLGFRRRIRLAMWHMLDIMNLDDKYYRWRVPQMPIRNDPPDWLVKWRREQKEKADELIAKLEKEGKLK